jgi:hypothetical protein
MDITQLAHSAALLLTPFLPYLIKAGERAMEETGKNMAGDAWEKAKSLWSKLGSKIENSPAALEVAQKAIAKPQDPRVQSALELHLESMLSDNAALADEVAKVIMTDMSSVRAIVTSDHGVAAGRDATGNINITGDGVIVGDGNTSNVSKN